MRGVDANQIKNSMDHSSLVVTQRHMTLVPPGMSKVAVAVALS